MNKADKYYLDNLNKLLNEGSEDENPRPKYKDGTPAHSKFITQVFEEYNISNEEFPIPTLRNTAIKTGIKEILWIYQKQSNSLFDAQELDINWWDDWDIGDGTIGQRYGATIKRYNLMNNLLISLDKLPFSRRHIINMYQQQDLEESVGLYPCAYETLWSVRKINNEFYLDLTLIQRSNDYLVAKYINSIQYVALQMMVVGHLNNENNKKWKCGKFFHFIQNLHVYDRHLDAIQEILNKTPLDIQPKLILKENKNFYDYKITDFTILNTDKITNIKTKLELGI
jgi:thymidylate synthase